MTIEENFVFPVYIHDNTIKKIILYCKNFKNEIFNFGSLSILSTIEVTSVSSRYISSRLIKDSIPLPSTITIEDAVHKFGLKENDKLVLWAKVIGGV